MCVHVRRCRMLVKSLNAYVTVCAEERTPTETHPSGSETTDNTPVACEPAPAGHHTQLDGKRPHESAQQYEAARYAPYTTYAPFAQRQRLQVTQTQPLPTYSATPSLSARVSGSAHVGVGATQTAHSPMPLLSQALIAPAQTTKPVGNEQQGAVAGACPQRAAASDGAQGTDRAEHVGNPTQLLHRALVAPSQAKPAAAADSTRQRMMRAALLVPQPAPRAALPAVGSGTQSSVVIVSGRLSQSAQVSVQARTGSVVIVSSDADPHSITVQTPTKLAKMTDPAPGAAHTAKPAPASTAEPMAADTAATRAGTAKPVGPSALLTAACVATQPARVAAALAAEPAGPVSAAVASHCHVMAPWLDMWEDRVWEVSDSVCRNVLYVESVLQTGEVQAWVTALRALLQ